jgi:hypothetical protein
MPTALYAYTQERMLQCGSKGSMGVTRTNKSNGGTNPMWESASDYIREIG